MSEDRAKAPPSAFPELELDLGPVRPRQAAVVAEEDEPQEVAIELDAPSRRPEAAGFHAMPSAPPSGPTSMRGPTSMGPPVSARAAPTSMGPPSTPVVPPASLPPSSTPMGPPPGYASGLVSGAPPPGSVTGDPTVPPPSAAAALMARAKTAAQDPGAVARNVAEVGNRTSTALVMLGGAILLTILDVIYSHVTGERFSIGPMKLSWLAGPLAFAGAIVLAVRLSRERPE